MDNNKLKLYYKYFVPITILQSVTSLLLMSVLSVTDYGLFTLYLSAISFFFFLNFGLQNGYTITTRKEQVETHNAIALNSTLTLLVIGLGIISIPILKYIPVELYWKLAYISGLLNVVFVFQKSVFRTAMRIHSISIYTLLFRVILLIDIAVYGLTMNIYDMFIFDIMLRTILIIGGSVVIYLQLRGTEQVNIKQVPSDAGMMLKIGIPIMFGNWFISLFTVIDKMFISSNQQMLGMYSFAITSVLLVRVLLIPLNELIFVALDENESSQQFITKLKRAWKYGSCLVVVGAIGAIIAIDYLGIFAKYQSALPGLLILLNILPLIVSLDVFIYNYMRKKSGRKFMVYASVAVGVSALAILLITNIFGSISLVSYCLVILAMYFAVYVMFIASKLSIKQTLMMSARYLIFISVYLGLIAIYFNI